MFTIKKPAIIIVLTLLLVLTGYINHKLTQQSLLKASNDYQNHEETEMANKLDPDEKELVETLSEGDEKKKEKEKGKDKKSQLEVVDSKGDENVSSLTEKADSNIEATISGKSSLGSQNYFIEHRLSRDKLRANLIDKLNEVVNNDKTDNEVRKEAQKEIIRLGNVSEKELHIEGLIKAKGFDDVLVFLKEEEARIVVSTNELTEQDVVKILEIVRSETELDTNQVKVMKKD
ncbi:MAG TPA: SpoIIIAH-like family protein [Tissierellales bacterium]|nr:SpoIIIAH-like family protein [Tissierellales bacterium]